MRFLCLHGAGTSAEIFKLQTASFRGKLKIDPPPTFDFIDGPFQSTPAAGISLFYAPPYYSFYPSQSMADLSAAHTWLLNFLSQHGPYDGVMTFSQGGALASSLMLQHSIYNVDPPFKVAVFICSGIGLPFLESLGIPVSQEAKDWDENSKKALFAQADNQAILAKGKDRWLGVMVKGETSHIPKREDVKENDVFGLDFENKIGKDWRIRDVPTVHIYGNRDPRYPASLQLAHFCEEKKEFDHGAGHEIPRNKEVSERIARLIEWAVEKAELN